MRLNKTRIQVGDILYEASILNREVVKWNVIGIFLEHVSENKWNTWVKIKSSAFVEERLLDDILYMHDTHDEAEKLLKKALRGS